MTACAWYPHDARSEASCLPGTGCCRRVATESGLRVHGVLWVVDELWNAGACSAGILLAALQCWRDDRAVFLPDSEIAVRLRRISGSS